MRIFTACLLIALCTLAQAGVYKRTDAQGNVEYTDVPRSTQEKPIPLPPPSTYTPPPVSGTAAGPQGGAQVVQSSVYRSVTISQPADDEAVRDNAGNLSIQVSSDPALQANHRFVVLIDGAKQAEGRGGSLQVENVDRGTHSLQVNVVDGGGRVLASSPVVKFHMLRISVLQNKDSSSPYQTPTPYQTPSPYQLPAPYRNAP
jgi:hypothetical protein